MPHDRSHAPAENAGPQMQEEAQEVHEANERTVAPRERKGGEGNPMKEGLAQFTVAELKILAGRAI